MLELVRRQEMAAVPEAAEWMTRAAAELRGVMEGLHRLGLEEANFPLRGTCQDMLAWYEEFERSLADLVQRYPMPVEEVVEETGGELEGESAACGTVPKSDDVPMDEPGAVDELVARGGLAALEIAAGAVTGSDKTSATELASEGRSGPQPVLSGTGSDKTSATALHAEDSVSLDGEFVSPSAEPEMPEVCGGSAGLAKVIAEGARGNAAETTDVPVVDESPEDGGGGRMAWLRRLMIGLAAAVVLGMGLAAALILGGSLPMRAREVQFQKPMEVGRDVRTSLRSFPGWDVGTRGGQQPHP